MSKAPMMMIAAMLLLTAGRAVTQEVPEQLRERIGASRYYLGKENELLIPVNILGYVNKPGQYMVPNETDLISLVAFAGGFREDAKINKIKILRGIAAHGQPDVMKVDLKKYFETGNRELIPRLMPDDTIVITGSRAVTIKNILDFTARVSVLVQIYFYLQVAKQR
ncbi:MAG: SLBB domain-containing protein [candidate division KSB1 bacterium]|nr:SLBB domain-containing protein [candidate division KSB1 bacterium]MDZ7301679.1 SLBB domain-containing protein [candidate division KSB1 bacterium]MDZ7314297.1 SLBB domain-containing protein [candidate division KSB1 bacterium]